jgi:hypothetical protein
MKLKSSSWTMYMEEIPLSFNGIYKVAVAVQRQRVLCTENSEFASPALGSAHFHVSWRIECILLKFHWGMKSLIELHFQHEDVFRSTLSYPNETSKECIQFLNKVCISTMNYVSSNPTGGRGGY